MLHEIGVMYCILPEYCNNIVGKPFHVIAQGISGPQKFQIHKSYGPQDRLPSAHTCFNQLDILEYESKEQLKDRLMVAIHEGSEGFGFG